MVSPVVKYGGEFCNEEPSTTMFLPCDLGDEGLKKAGMMRTEHVVTALNYLAFQPSSAFRDKLSVCNLYTGPGMDNQHPS